MTDETPPNVRLMLGDCLELMAEIPDGSVDAIVTDPPAGIAFMSKEWDGAKGGRDAWIEWLSVRLTECLRITKPGGRMLCWAIPRTSHWTGTAIEDAGWIVEDVCTHLFATGFPKAKSKLKPAAEFWFLARKPSKGVPVLPGLDACRIEAIGRPHIESRSEVSLNTFGNGLNGSACIGKTNQGRYPANLVLSHAAGCNGECVDGCPVAELDRQSGNRGASGQVQRQSPHASNSRGEFNGIASPFPFYGDSGGASRFFFVAKASKSDRNSGLDGHEIIEVELMCDINSRQEVSSWEFVAPKVRLRVDTEPSRPRVIEESGTPDNFASEWNTFLFGSDPTGQSQKGCKSTTKTASSSTTESRTLNWLVRSLTNAFTVDVSCETESGSNLAGIAERSTPSITITLARTVSLPGVGSVASGTRLRMTGNAAPPGNIHNTVKSTALMSWLCRLITPPGGIIADPFMGSGSTGKAAVREGFRFTGIERDPDYFAIAERRISAAQSAVPLFHQEPP